MKRLQILAFRDTNTNHIYNLQDTTGNYVYGDNKYHLFSCFDKEFKVYSVKDKIRNIIFKIGDVVNTAHGEKQIIGIKMVGCSDTTTAQFILFTNNAANTVLMPSTTKYVVPVPIPVTVAAPKVLETGSSNEVATLQDKIIKSFNGRTLKFAVFKRKKTETFDEFKSLFFKRNSEFITIYSDTETEQCSRGRRRSMGDIFMICKYYYPSLTLDKIIQWLYGPGNGHGSLFCGQVQKRVYRQDYNEHNHNMNDEYGNSIGYYDNLIKQNPVKKDSGLLYN